MSQANEPQSDYLNKHTKLPGGPFFTSELLGKFHDELIHVNPTSGTEKEEIEKLVAALPHADVQKLCKRLGHNVNPFGPESKKVANDFAAFPLMKILVKLGLLTLKWRRLAASQKIKDTVRSSVIKPNLTVLDMWEMITRRTDQIYLSSEDMLDPYKEKLKRLQKELNQKGAPPVLLSWPGLLLCSSSQLPSLAGLKVELSPGELKDPVRIHEKAMDDYVGDFDDWRDDYVIPEACVNDVLRCRVIAKDAAALLALEQILKEEEFEGFKLLRTKNKFNAKELSPTHFRCMLNNLLLEEPDGRSTFVEMQAAKGLNARAGWGCLTLPETCRALAGAPGKDHGVLGGIARPRALRLLPGASAGPVRKGDRLHARQDDRRL